jgi:AGZA family xanthine/uracil permease-like MFS transporter
MLKITESGSNIKTEVIAGVTTFMTMAYIIFVNPIILSDPSGAGMDFNSVIVATCVSSALATLIMAFVANYPIALAPGMGMNVFFSYEIAKGMGIPWQVCLGIVFLSGVIFVLLTLVGIREKIFIAVPHCMKFSIPAGIGIFIAFIGMKNAGIIVGNPGTLVHIGDLRNERAIIAIAGFLFTAVLASRRIRGAIFWGLIFTAFLSIISGTIEFSGKFLKLPSMSQTFLQLDIKGAFKLSYITPLVIFLFFAMFDAIGTLIGVGEKAGFIKEGEFPRLNRALFVDATGSIIGSLCGTSTVTCYIESAAGVSEGGRTGLANVVTALFFLIAMFFSPLAEVFTAPVVAPALIVVGTIMMETARKINWDDFTEALPAFLTIISMPLTFSITTGLTFGFVSYVFVKLFSGRWREVHWLIYLIVCLIILGYFL